MKKNMIYIIISIIILFSLLPVTYVQAADGDDWVQDAFNAANNFLGEDPTLSENGEIAEIEETMFEKMKMIVKAINRILLVLLFGLSAISLGVIGIRYILAGSSPHQKEAAKHSLHTAFLGMGYGFGAFIIWNVAMQIVQMILGTFANQ